LSDAVLALFAHVQVDSFVGRIAGTDFIVAAGMYEEVRRELAELPREPDEPVQ